MCTVTYLPTPTGFILTSSRDEYDVRATLMPATYKIKEQFLSFPKDVKAGGTWIAASEYNKVACLLNGAFENFEPKENHIVSRGKILLDYFNYDTSEDFVKTVDCSQVAPFTLLMLDVKGKIKINQFRWDGDRKFIQSIDSQKPRIWASATLYDKSIRDERKRWFTKWLSSNNNDDIKSFHLSDHTEDQANNIVMKREAGLQTVSLTQIVKEQETFYMLYHDLKEKLNSKIDLPLCESVLL